MGDHQIRVLERGSGAFCLNRAAGLAERNSLGQRETLRGDRWMLPTRGAGSSPSWPTALHGGRRQQKRQNEMQWNTQTIVTRIEDFQDLLSAAEIHSHYRPSYNPRPRRRIQIRHVGSIPMRESGYIIYLTGRGDEARGKGMAEIRGFIRQQEICILYSKQVLPTSVTWTTSGTSQVNATPPIFPRGWHWRDDCADLEGLP